MTDSLRLINLRCRDCGDETIIGPHEIARRLREAGQLRREANPEQEIVLALFEEFLPNLKCDACGANNWKIADVPIDENHWGEPVLCEVCKQQVPPERLEIFPNEKRCAACKDKPETDEPEFCAICGGLMAIRQRGGSGIAGYVMVCTDCGRSG
ncbi:MAG: hypothetical protein KDB27_23445 [Planctomycetales bacterium]|nr:hypothetical protein [Planctomycetales bacterium]